MVSEEDLFVNIRNYVDIDRVAFSGFLALLKEVEFNKRDYLLNAGEVCRQFTLIREGCVMNYFIDQKGAGHVIQFATPLWWTADLESLATQQVSRFYIQAITPVTAWQLSFGSMNLLLRELPVFEKYFRIIFQNALVSHQRRILEHKAGPRPLACPGQRSC
jgi:CRP-like cAMP-binding protein